MKRPEKYQYYYEIALAVSKRSNCLKRHYGCIIVKNDEIIATGYNGSPRGEQNCCDLLTCKRIDAPHNSGDYSDCHSVHAEQNAMLSASRKDMIGSTMYLAGEEYNEKTGNYDPFPNPEPCPICLRMIKNSGIENVVTIDENGNKNTVYSRTEPIEKQNEPYQIIGDDGGMIPPFTKKRLKRLFECDINFPDYPTKFPFIRSIWDIFATKFCDIFSKEMNTADMLFNGCLKLSNRFDNWIGGIKFDEVDFLLASIDVLMSHYIMTNDGNYFQFQLLSGDNNNFDELMKEYQTMVTNNQLYLPKFPLIDFEEFLLERYFPNDREQYSYNLAYVMSFLLKTVCYYQISKDSINQDKIDLDNIGHDDEMLIKDLYDKIISVMMMKC